MTEFRSRAEGRAHRRGRDRAVLRPRVRGASRGARITAVADVAAAGRRRDRRGGARHRVPVAPGAARGGRRRRGARLHAAVDAPRDRAAGDRARPPRAVREAAGDRRAQRAATMVAAAEQAGVVFTMAAKFRFVDDVIRARQIVGSGILGELIVLENSFASRVDMTRRWNADPAISGGGVLIDNGTHSVDIVRYFLGPIAEVMAVEGKRVQHLAVEDTASMLLRTADGVLGTIDLSWSVDKVTDTYLTRLRLAGHDQRRLERRALPAGLEPRVGRVRQRLRQDRVHGRAGRELLRGDPRRGAARDHRRTTRSHPSRSSRRRTRRSASSDWISVRGCSGAATPRQVSRWHDASASRSAHPSDRGDRGRRRDRRRHRDLVRRPRPRPGHAHRRRVHRRREHAHRVRRADRRPGQAQRVRLRLHRRHDRERRDDRRGHDLHQRPLPAGDHARPRRRCAPSEPDERTLPDPGRRGRVDRRRLRDRLRPRDRSVRARRHGLGRHPQRARRSISSSASPPARSPSSRGSASRSCASPARIRPIATRWCARSAGSATRSGPARSSSSTPRRERWPAAQRRAESWAVVGGGMLGLTLALRLREQGKRVTVFERGRPGRRARQRVVDRDAGRRHHLGPALPRDPAVGLRAAARCSTELGLDAEMQWVETKTGLLRRRASSRRSRTRSSSCGCPGCRSRRRCGSRCTILHGSRVKDWERLEQETGRALAHALVGARDVPALLAPAAAGEARRELAGGERRVHLGDDPTPVRGAPQRAEEGDVRLRARWLRARARPASRRCSTSGASRSAARRRSSGSSAPTAGLAGPARGRDGRDASTTSSSPATRRPRTGLCAGPDRGRAGATPRASRTRASSARRWCCGRR